MSVFTIEIDPPLTPAPVAFSDVSPTAEEWSRLVRIPGEYNVIYRVDGQQFCYYASSMATMLNDLLWEWQRAKASESHEMTLSGYTVLSVSFEDGRVLIYDPGERFGSEKNARAVATLTTSEFLDEFKKSLDAVWHEVTRQLNAEKGKE